MTNKNKNYKEDLSINQDALDVEWKKQPILFAEWAEEAVNAQYDRDKAKEKLDLIRAEADTEIRRLAVKEGEKLTEGAITSKILQSKKYQEHLENFLQKTKTAKIFDIARDAFEHRKRALENITQLFLSNYYAETYVPKGAKKAVQQTDQNNSQKALSESMNNREPPEAPKRTLLRRKEG